MFLPYQLSWINDHSQVKIIEKSRRIGISWAESFWAVQHASLVTGSDVWYVGYNREMAFEFIRDCTTFANALQIVTESAGVVVMAGEQTASQLRFTSGHRITSLSSRPENLRGKKGFVIIDEAAFHPDLDELLKSAFALKIWGGGLHIISTHNGEQNLFNQLINQVKAGEKNFSLHRVTFQDALNDGLYKTICDANGKQWSQIDEYEWAKDIYQSYGDQSSEELDVVPSSGAGTYLPRSLTRAVAVDGIPVVRLALDNDFTERPDRITFLTKWLATHTIELNFRKSRLFIGVDFGRTRDLSVIWVLLRDSANKYHTLAVYELRNVPFEEQKKILFHILSRINQPFNVALDARGNGQYLSEVTAQKFGSRVNPVMLSVNWYIEYMPVMKALFETKDINIPDDDDIITDLNMIQLKDGVAKIGDNRSKDKDGNERHGDAAIALALAVSAAYDNQSGMQTFIPVKRKRDLDDD